MSESEVSRMSPEDVRRKIQTGMALLVCAYQSEEKFNRYRLAGAISYSDFLARKSGLSKEQEIIFYCN